MLTAPRLYGRLTIPAVVFELQRQKNAIESEILRIMGLPGLWSTTPATDADDIARMEGEGGVPC